MILMSRTTDQSSAAGTDESTDRSAAATTPDVVSAGEIARQIRREVATTLQNLHGI
ncbi:hypothetical protein [Streptomyces sp. NBC_01190]|uniref:hypothetical protein n=1 Tax=Streptomyces sp. NBC_01190 TaxID=2903767 RepID=UPI00386E5277|nr:hypothetical protein OG519_13805 [Streptomyces sp. NBC_01190]